MLHIAKQILMFAGVAGLAFGANAWHDDDDWNRDRDRRGVYRDDPYYRDDGSYRRDDRYRDGYGRGRNSGPYSNNGRYAGDAASMASQIRNDLGRIASRTRADNHERNHFQKAQQELSKFEDRMRQGRFDQGALDKSIDNVQHLVSSNQIMPRDRNVLMQDLRSLQNMRANGGGGYGYNPYRY